MGATEFAWFSVSVQSVFDIGEKTPSIQVKQDSSVIW